MMNDMKATNAVQALQQSFAKDAKEREEAFRYERTMQIEYQKVNAEHKSAEELAKQTSQMSSMVKATFDMVQEQQKSNTLQEESNQTLKQQLEFLQKQNEEQAKELKSNKVFQWISWGVTTFVAIGAVVVSIIGICKK